jgi:cation diffusion facilitator family transporter
MSSDVVLSVCLYTYTDSVVDIISQAVLALATRYMNIHHLDYPVGRSKLEALSVLACSTIMAVTSIEVIQFSCIDLAAGFSGDVPVLEVNWIIYLSLGTGILMKLVLYLYCRTVTEREPSDILSALAEDHINDVFSNAAALVTVSLAYNFDSLWWLDPVGAIAISLVIVYRWSFMITEQVKKLIGFTAPPEWVDMVNDLAKTHDDRILLDCTRAYHFGARFNVEMEIVLPADMSVRESHDIGLALQHKIEELEDVERAFVHIDHETRDGLEHKIERTLTNSSRYADIGIFSLII